MPDRKDAVAGRRPPDPWRARAARALSIAASCVVFAGLGFGAIVGVPWLEARLAERLHAQSIRVEINWPPLGGQANAQAGDQAAAPRSAAPGRPVAAGAPAGLEPATWVPQPVRDQLMTVAHAAIEAEPQPFSPAGLRATAQALADTGWFERIDGVRRGRDASGQPVVRVDAVWRVPAAVVRFEDYDYLVSRTAQIMPVAYPRGTSPMHAIVGASRVPERDAGRIMHGQAWPGPDIDAALQVLALVAGRPWAEQVESIDVSQYTASRTLVLVTRAGGRIVWGGAPSDAVPGEVGTAVKLARLDALAARFQGRVDAGHRRLEIFGPVTTVDNSATADASPAARAP